MATLPEEERQQEAMWREVLTRGRPNDNALRWILKRVPSPPRCKNCFVPFGGFAGKLVGLTGMRPSRKNPRMCDS